MGIAVRLLFPLVFLASTAGDVSHEVTVVTDKATVRSFHSAIIAAGHACPGVKLAFAEAELSMGDLFMVYCGLRPRDGAFAGFPALMYRVIKIARAPLLVVPW